MDCLFCKIVKKDIQSDIILEDNDFLAFKDINPKAPIHILVIPKEHIPSIMDINDLNKDLITKVWQFIQKLAKKLNIDQHGFRLIVNNGKFAGQEVFHLHFHVLAGKPLSWEKL